MRTLAFILAGLAAAATANASGYRPPAHSELAYSFTCPSGASGHLRYVVDMAATSNRALTLWVNGRYLQDDPAVAAALRGRNVEQLQASCEGDNTLLFLRTFEPGAAEDSKLQWLHIAVDRAGAATVAD